MPMVALVMNARLLLVSLMVLGFHILPALGREWTSADGRTKFTGTLYQCHPPVMKIFDSSSHMVTMNVSQLSAADQRYCEIAKPFVDKSYLGMTVVVLESMADGIVVREIAGRLSFSTNEVLFIRGDHNNSMRPGANYTFNLYNVGTYNYTPSGGGNARQLRAFVPNLDTAVYAIEPRLAPGAQGGSFVTSAVPPPRGGVAQPPGSPPSSPPRTAVNGVYSSPTQLAPRKRSGTGFAVTSDGYIVTNDHVVKGGRSIVVWVNGVSCAATLVTEDANNDLAVIKIATPTTPLKLALSEPVLLGDSVAAMGFSDPDLEGASARLTRGTVSSALGFHDDSRQFQIDSPIASGFSGGPLLNGSRAVVGVADSIALGSSAGDSPSATASRAGYAVKGSRLTTLLSAVPGLGSRIIGEEGKGTSGSGAPEKGVYAITVDSSTR